MSGVSKLRGCCCRLRVGLRVAISNCRPHGGTPPCVIRISINSVLFQGCEIFVCAARWRLFFAAVDDDWDFADDDDDYGHDDGVDDNATQAPAQAPVSGSSPEGDNL